MISEDWREFEKLVARIEAALSPQGAEVASPDRVKDLVTGNLREVDASIRYKIGTVPLLITIECRRREEVQDVIWIEQLATKKHHIGAAKTIAVCLSGFSEPAQKAARMCGIEVRQISEITAEEILGWLRLTGVVTIETKSEVVYVRFGFPHENFGIDPSVQRLLRQDAVSAPVFFLPAEGKTITLASIIEQSRRSGPDFLEDAPADGTKELREVVLTPPPGNVQVNTPHGYQDLGAIIIGLNVWAERREVPIEKGTIYSDDQKTLVHSLAFGIEVQGQPVTVSLHNEVGANGVHVLVSREPVMGNAEPHRSQGEADCKETRETG